MSAPSDKSVPQYKSIPTTVWALLVVYWITLLAAGLISPYTLFGLMPLAVAAIISLLIARKTKKHFALKKPSAWLCLGAGWIIGFFVLLALTPRGGLELGALFASFYLFFFVPLVTPILGTLLGGALQLFLLYRRDLRLSIAWGTPFVAFWIIYVGVSYLQRHVPTYEELFVARFDADGVYLGEQILSTRNETERGFPHYYTIFETEKDIVSSDGSALWVLTTSVDVSASLRPSPGMLRKYSLTDLSKPLFVVPVDQEFATTARSISPLEDGGAIVLSSGQTPRHFPYRGTKWTALRFNASGEELAGGRIVLPSEESMNALMPEVSPKGALYALYLTNLQNGENRSFTATLRLKKYPSPSESGDAGWEVELGTTNSPQENEPLLVSKGADEIYVVRHSKSELKVLSYTKHGSLISESAGESGGDIPQWHGPNGEALRFRGSPPDTGFFIFSLADEFATYTPTGLQRVKADGTIDKSFAYAMKAPSDRRFSTAAPMLALKTPRYVFVAGNSIQTDRGYNVVDHGWWMTRISPPDPTQDRGSAVQSSVNRNEGYERVVHLGLNDTGEPFVVGRRQGLGWSSGSKLSTIATAFYERSKGTASIEPASIESLTEAPRVEKVDGSPADNFFPNPFVSSCSKSPSLRRPLEPNAADGPTNLRYRSNLNQTITFKWDCPSSRPGPHIFEFDCCNCDERLPPEERHGFENLEQTEFTIKAAVGREYLWHVSCGFSYAPISHDSLATFGKAGETYYYKYYDFPSDRTPEPEPTPYQQVDLNKDLEEKVNQFQKILQATQPKGTRPIATPNPEVFQAVGSISENLTYTTADETELASLLKKVGLTLTPEEMNLLISRNSMEPFSLPEGPAFEAIKQRFVGREVELISVAANGPTELERLVLHIAGKVTNFKSPEAQKLLEMHLLSADRRLSTHAYSVAAWLPPGTLPESWMSMFSQRALATPATEKNALAIKALGRFGDPALPFMKTVAVQLAYRTDEDQYFDENNLQARRIVIPSKDAPTPECQRPDVKRDTLSREMDAQLEKASDNVMSVVLAEWLKSNDWTLKWLAIDVLLSRSTLPQAALPFAEELSRSKNAYEQLVSVSLQSKVPQLRLLASKRLDTLLSGRGAKCLNQAEFLTALRFTGSLSLKPLTEKFDSETDRLRLLQISSLFESAEQIDHETERRVLARLEAVASGRCGDDGSVARSLAHLLAKSPDPLPETIQFLTVQSTKGSPDDYNLLRDGTVEALLHLAIRDVRYHKILVEAPNFVVPPRTFLAMLPLRKKQDAETQKLVEILDRRPAELSRKRYQAENDTALAPKPAEDTKPRPKPDSEFRSAASKGSPDPKAVDGCPRLSAGI